MVRVWRKNKNEYILINEQQANDIRGNYGIYSRIEPVQVSSKNYIVPKRCKDDKDLKSVSSIIVNMINETEKIINVKYLGANGDGVNDDTQYIQSAIDKVAGGGVVLFPIGVYLITSPLSISNRGISLVGESIDYSIIRSKSSDIIHISTTNITFEYLNFQSQTDSAGHVFYQTGGVSSMIIRNIKATVTNADKSIWDNNNNAFIGCSVSNSQFNITSGHNVPAFSFVSSGGDINGNFFNELICNYSGNYFFLFDGGSSTLFDNRVTNIIFEVTNGGCIKLSNCYNHIIENCNVYDAQLGGEITKDLFYLTGTGECKHTSIKNCFRRGGVLASGIYDIKINAASRTLIEGGGASGGSAFAIDANSRYKVTLLNCDVTPDNLASTTVQITGSVKVGGVELT